jgi:antitoxin component YwqK of YwqJK toxin-antitoxin module
MILMMTLRIYYRNGELRMYKRFHKFSLITSILIFCVFGSQKRDTVIVKTDTFVTIKDYYPNSKQVQSESVYKNGWKRDGLQRDWFLSGKIQRIGQYVDDCPVDTSKRYFENGQLKSIEPYSNCKIDGIKQAWNEKGDLILRYPYRNGKPIGVQEELYSKDHKKRVCTYSDSGIKIGTQINWYENGNMKDSTFYNNKGEITEVKIFHTNGKMEMWYRPDTTVDMKSLDKGETERFFDPDGKPCGSLIEGTGEYITFGPDGKPANKIIRKNNRIIETIKITK